MPAADPLVLAVGRTSLDANRATGAYMSETAWRRPAAGPSSSPAPSPAGPSSSPAPSPPGPSAAAVPTHPFGREPGGGHG